MGDNAPSTEDVIDKFEYALAPTQDVIESISKWCLDRRQNYESIVKAWLALFYISGDQMRLSLLFLMNDVCQRERHLRSNKFRKAFMQKIKMIVLISRSRMLLPHLARIVKIWEDRSVFGKELTNELRVLSSNELLNERSASVISFARNDLGQSSTPESNAYDSSYVKLLREFSKPTLVKAVRHYAEDKAVWASPRNDPKGCIAKEELMKCVRDRDRGRRIMSDVNDAFNRYYDAVDTHRLKVVHLNKLVACLELASIFYLTQGHEASVVCAAYYTFANRLAVTTEECNDMSKMCPPTQENNSTDKPQAGLKGDSPQTGSASTPIEEDPVLAQQIKAVLTAIRKEEDNEAVDMELEEEGEEERDTLFVNASRSNVPPAVCSPVLMLPRNVSITSGPPVNESQMQHFCAGQWRIPRPPAQTKPANSTMSMGPPTVWTQPLVSSFDVRMPPPMRPPLSNLVSTMSPAAGGAVLPCPLGTKSHLPAVKHDDSFAGGQKGFGGPTPAKLFAHLGYNAGEADRYSNSKAANLGNAFQPMLPFSKPNESPGVPPRHYGRSHGHLANRFANDRMPSEHTWMQQNSTTREDGTAPGKSTVPPLGPHPSDRLGPPPSDFAGSGGPPPPISRFDEKLVAPYDGGADALPPPYIGDINKPMIGELMGAPPARPSGALRGLMYQPRHHFQGQRHFGNGPPHPRSFDHSVHRMRTPAPFRGTGNEWTPRLSFRPTDPSTGGWSSDMRSPASDSTTWEPNIPPYGIGSAGTPNHMMQPVRQSLLGGPVEPYATDFAASRFAPVPPSLPPPICGGNRRNFRRL
uniref:CID domain-containing protein n=1 Tax=Trichuris muris TaxID=70415 RepID=A0A5S6QF66_TRIMR